MSRTSQRNKKRKPAGWRLPKDQDQAASRRGPGVVERVAGELGRALLGPGSPSPELGLGLLELYGAVTGDRAIAAFARGALEARTRSTASATTTTSATTPAAGGSTTTSPTDLDRVLALRLDAGHAHPPTAACDGRHWVGATVCGNNAPSVAAGRRGGPR